VELKKHL